MKKYNNKTVGIRRLVATRLAAAVAAILLCAFAAYTAAWHIQLYQMEHISDIPQPDLFELDMQTLNENELNRMCACLLRFSADGRLLSRCGYEIHPNGKTLEDFEDYIAEYPEDYQLRKETLEDGTLLLVQDQLAYSYGLFARAFTLVLWSATCIAGILVLVILFVFVRAVYRPIRRDFETIGAGIENSPSFAPIEEKGVRLAEALTLVRRYNQAVHQIELEQAEKQRAMQAGDLLISNLAHDLKSPITVLKGYAEVLADGGLNEQETAKYVGYLYKSANELRDLVDLLFEQIGYRSGRAVLHKSRIDLCEVLRESCANYYMLFAKRGFRFETDIPETVLMTFADRLALERVFGNLLRNILDHNENPCAVWISCETAGSIVRITFADDGQSIPAQALPQLFEPFFRADSARSDESHRGLGLFAAKQILEQHGGSIKASVPAGGGAAFEVMLPLSEG